MVCRRDNSFNVAVGMKYLKSPAGENRSLNRPMRRVSYDLISCLITSYGVAREVAMFISGFPVGGINGLEQVTTESNKDDINIHNIFLRVVHIDSTPKHT